MNKNPITDPYQCRWQSFILYITINPGNTPISINLLTLYIPPNTKTGHNCIHAQKSTNSTDLTTQTQGKEEKQLKIYYTNTSSRRIRSRRNTWCQNHTRTEVLPHQVERIHRSRKHLGTNRQSTKPSSWYHSLRTETWTQNQKNGKRMDFTLLQRQSEPLSQKRRYPLPHAATQETRTKRDS